MLSSQPKGLRGMDSGDRKHFSARHVLNVSEQGSKLRCRPPFFSNTVDFTVGVCALCFVDVDTQEPVTQCSWREFIDFAQVLDHGSVEIKSMSFAYNIIASQRKLWLAGGRRGRHPRKVRRAVSRYTMKSTGDSESPCGVPAVVLNGAERTSSILTVTFVSDSRSCMIRTLYLSRNKYKTHRNVFRRIVSKY